MAGRALVFSNPDVIELLKTSFVPYAGDQWYLHRQQDAAGKFFWKVAQQGYRRDAPIDETRQGLYAATPDGTLLASDCFRPSPAKALDLMKSALKRWESLPHSEAVSEESSADRQYLRKPPEGGLILDVYSRIPSASSLGASWSPNQATGRDHMWLTREDVRALLPPTWKNGVQYRPPAAVAERLARFHLVDNVRGEPNMWGPGEVALTEMTLIVEDAAKGRIRLQGTARMRHGQERGYDSRVQGDLTVDRKEDRFTRFDLLAWGEAFGEGPYTRGAPRGPFPLVIAFSLAGHKAADLVPPQGSRHLPDYLGTGQARP